LPVAVGGAAGAGAPDGCCGKGAGIALDAVTGCGGPAGAFEALDADPVGAALGAVVADAAAAAPAPPPAGAPGGSIGVTSSPAVGSGGQLSFA